jgi:hypothetical protein
VRLGRRDHRGIVSGDCGVVAVIEQRLHQRHECLVDFGLVLIGDSLRLQVRALHEANARTQMIDARHVVRRSHQHRLQDNSDVAIALAPERLEDLQRHIRIRRILHVDPDEEAVLRGGLEDAPQVIDRGRPIDVQAQLRQLDRHIALDARPHDGVEDAQVLARGSIGFLCRRGALTEIIERDEQPLVLDAANGRNGLIDRFARDEPAGKPLGSHAVARCEPFQESDLSE